MIHEFFLFLGTESGLLLKKFIELIFYTILAYMITSEFIRERTDELKYLFFAFTALVVENLITVSVLSASVFGKLVLTRLNFFLPVLDSTLELTALILLANAFIYPYRNKPERIVSSMKLELYALFVLAFFIQVHWIFSRGVDISTDISYLIFTIIRAVVLLYPVYFILHVRKKLKYTFNIVIAFLIYSVVPILQVINWVFYSDENAKLMVAMQPFPFISILVFTQVVYLKLVDKATLRARLAESEKKYVAEKEVGELKDEFVSVVSHELRTPLTSMKLYTSLMQSGKFGAVSKKQKEALHVIKSEADRLTELINDILTLSKIEANKEKLHLTDFDATELIRECPLFKMAEEKKIDIKLKIPPIFLVRADRDKIHQVYINLLSNAIKFTSSGGIIKIVLKELPDKWMLAINDNGIGIKEDDRDKLFSKFFQSQNYMTKTEHGTGLGLAIAKKIVDMHHGDIRVTSELGRGSTFSVFIPKDL
jgi:signal transduction histidine kinase